MKRRMLCGVAISISLLLHVAAAQEKPRAAEELQDDPARNGGDAAKVYGEWRIQVHPDKGPAYEKLIEEQGLPLFRAAGGRMVGWWKTLVGDLYEHVTIWEYDDMAAFEGAIEFLGGEPRFADFVSKRDPLLDGEDSRFLRLAPFAEPPRLPEQAPYIIHEIHRVPLGLMGDYVKFMQNEGLELVKRHGFRPAGPWSVDIGSWSEVTWLFRFDSLEERERLIGDFVAHQDGDVYGKRIGELVDDVTIRVLVPAPFASRKQPPDAREQGDETSWLPHQELLAPGVHVAGFADRYASANCGWVAMHDHTLLVDLPRGVDPADFVRNVTRQTGLAPRRLVLTHAGEPDLPLVAALVEQGIEEVLVSPATRQRLEGLSESVLASVRVLSGQASVGDRAMPAEFISLDEVHAGGAAALLLPDQGVLFAGPLVVNGPRSRLAASDTRRWVEVLQGFERSPLSHIVPGFGSWGGFDALVRQRRFLAELRRQIGWSVSRGRPREALLDDVRIGADDLVWMPYDTPTVEDLEHVYHELTVPQAPFHGHAPEPSDPRPHALVLIGDEPHEPGHLEQGLRSVFEASGVVAHFTVDARALSAENLAQVQLLVVLRDGLMRPGPGPDSNYQWMTPEQEQAVVGFVEGGGGFLNLHNSMGLYPEDGPYLNLVGGRYTGHGPLERFRVYVVDDEHPVTAGVESFSVADEQHEPTFDRDKVRLLLESRSDEGLVAAAGWAYEPGRGRLVHLAPGHTREALLHPSYQRLMRNAVNWCLRND